MTAEEFFKHKRTALWNSVSHGYDIILMMEAYHEAKIVNIIKELESSKIDKGGMSLSRDEMSVNDGIEIAIQLLKQ